MLHNGKAIPPRNAPPQVKRAIAAANSLVNKPYRLGGGHRKHYDSHYARNFLVRHPTGL